MKHDTETRNKAVALLLSGNSYADVETETGVSYTVLKTWKSRYRKTVSDETKPEKQLQSKKHKAVKQETAEPVTNSNGYQFRYTPPNQTVTETETPETEFSRKDAGLIAAVLVLCLASIISVGDILAHAYPVWFVGYLIATVVCTSPVLLLLSKRVTKNLAWVTMILAFIIEVACNAVAVMEKVTADPFGLQAAVSAVSGDTIGDVAFAWILGIGLPALALCFEVLLLQNSRED